MYSELLTDTVTTTRDTLGTRDALGQKSKTPATVLSAQPCLLQQLGESEKLQQGQTNIATHRLYLDFGVDITEQDRAVVTKPNGATRTMEVTAVDPDVAGQQHHIEVMCKEVST